MNWNLKSNEYRVPRECGLLYIGNTRRNLKIRLKEQKNCWLNVKFEKSAASMRWSYTTVSSGENLHSSSKSKIILQDKLEKQCKKFLDNVPEGSYRFAYMPWLLYSPVGD